MNKKCFTGRGMLLLIIFSLLSIVAAAYGQVVSVHVTKAPLTDVFKAIEKQSTIRFIYTRDLIEKSKPVTVSMNNADVVTVMEQCFQNQPLTWVMNDHYITIFERPVPRVNMMAEAGSITISGTVRTESGEPVVGATVSIVGTELASSTNVQGQFEVSGAAIGDILRVTNIGYEPAQVTIKGEQSIQMVLQKKIGQLDEAIVVGYGTTSRRYNLGSVSKITAADIAKQPSGNPLLSLQGRMPGVFIQTQNGLPGGNIKVQIRGQGSVAAGTNPLFIIDGVPFLAETSTFSPVTNGANGPVSPFTLINPSDIESIDVLKDAEATAIYGSRAANGVVLITTKKGTAGAAKLNFDFYKGFGVVSRKLEFLSLDEYLAVRREAFVNAGEVPDQFNAPDLTVWDQHESTDWQDYVFGGKAAITNAQVGLSGGTGGTSYLLGLNYRDEGTILPGDNLYRRAGGHLSVDHTSDDRKFSTSTRIMYSIDNNKIISDAAAANSISTSPNFQIYNPDGTLNFELFSNPATIIMKRAKSNGYNLLVNSNFRYQILNSLQAKLSAGYNRSTLDRKLMLPTAALNPLFGQPNSTDFASTSQVSYILEPQLDYHRQFGNIKSAWLAGATFQQAISDGTSLRGINYSNDDLLGNLGAAGAFIGQTNTFAERKYISGFTRLNLSWDERYLMSASFRRDGSTRFGPDKQFGNFGSVAVGWLFMNEKFLSSLSRVISYGKLRTSYGITGNDQIVDYGYLSSYGNSQGYANIAGLQPQRIANLEFGWETNKKWEAALELGLFKDRILVTTAYYLNRSGNQLIPYPVATQTGFSQYQANLPAIVINRGFELEVSSQNIQHNRLTWSTHFNISVPTNKLSSYPGLAQSSYANTYVVGEDLSVQRRLNLLYIDPANGIPVFEDVNKDNKFNTSDYVVIGKTSPDFLGGLENTLTFGGFEASILFQFVQQHSGTSVPPPGGSVRNVLALNRDRWKKPGDIATIPLAVVPSATAAYDAVSLLVNSNYIFLNSSYARLKNISLSYLVPRELLAKAHIQSIRIYVLAENLITLSRKEFVDPEMLNFSNPAMPVLRQFTGGITITL